jgi:hypothetical protein
MLDQFVLRSGNLLSLQEEKQVPMPQERFFDPTQFGYGMTADSSKRRSSHAFFLATTRSEKANCCSPAQLSFKSD